MQILTQHIEALIFAADPSISYDAIKTALEASMDTMISDEDLRDALHTLTEKYAAEDSALEVVEIAGGFRFMTKAAFHHTVGVYLKQNTQKKLSKAALETLSIVAYKQPVSRTEIEAIRGVNSEYSIQKLLDKELIEISGRSEGPGKPILYSTTAKFMDYFGLKSMHDLPQIKEFTPAENQIGEPAPAEELKDKDSVIQEN
ncbi:MAG: SMC-Scp complex subunit ScpB [Saprospiraceae bacterium]|nr:SMC-Scp complex subunit ScpB [Saprospiraceae bacterium]